MDLDRKVLEDERKKLAAKHDEVFSRLRGLQSEIEALRTEKVRLEKEAADARRLLESKISQEMESGKGRQLLDGQIKELKSELASVQAELSKERKSRADIALTNESKYNNLRRENESLTLARETVEKELYSQQDTLRRALEARSQSEKEKRNLQIDIKSLRERVSEVEVARAKAQAEIERSMSRQAKGL